MSAVNPTQIAAQCHALFKSCFYHLKQYLKTKHESLTLGCASVMFRQIFTWRANSSGIPPSLQVTEKTH